MKIHIYALAFCLAGVAACGDDDTNNPTNDGGNDAMVTPDATDDATVTPDATTDAAADATGDASEDGYYTGAPDQCVGQTYDGDSARTEAGNAGKGACLAVADGEAYRECVRDAVVENVEGIDDACGYCYGVSANCARDNCIAQCAADPSSAGCVTCRCDNGCYQAFDDCSGTTDSHGDNNCDG